MQCPRCSFENMPGITACFRCGSVLVADSPVDVSPPRAPEWKKPWRAMVRNLRRSRALRKIDRAADVTADVARKIPGLQSLRRSESFSLVLFRGLRTLSLAFPISVIPGLAQTLQGRFHRVFWYAVAWGASLLAGLFFFGSAWGVMLLSTAISMHAWIMVDAALPEGKVRRPMDRLFGVAVASLVVYLIYHGVYRLSPITFGHSAVTIQAQRVQLHDTLLCVKERSSAGPPERGDLVLVLTLQEELRQRRITGSAVGQVIGLPGETVHLAGDQFMVNGRLLDTGLFPVPAYMRGLTFTRVLDSSSYFIGMQYNVPQRGGNPRWFLEAVIGTSVHPYAHIQGRAVMRWFPVSRRGFLTE